VVPGNAPADAPVRSHVDASTRGDAGGFVPTAARDHGPGATRTTTTRPIHSSRGSAVVGGDVPASVGVDGGTAPIEPPASTPAEPPQQPGGREGPGPPTIPTSSGGSSSPSVPVVPTESSVGVGVDAGDSGSVEVTASVPSATSEPSPPSVSATTPVEVPAAPASTPSPPPAPVPTPVAAPAP
jgi:hypothetical protein